MPAKTKLPPLTTPPEMEANRWYDLDELIPWKDNYNEGDVGAIALSIRRFGFASDPRVWKDGNVRGGNHTVKALRMIKAEGPRAGDLHYPPARVRVEGDKWFIPCVDIGYLSEEDARGLAIADNRMAQRASQDDKRLLEYLQQMDESTLLAVGYDEDDVDYFAKMTEPMVNEGFYQPPEEAFETFVGGSIKQIMLYFDNAGYVEVTDKLNRVIRANNLDSNTAAVLHVLDYYLKNVNVPEVFESPDEAAERIIAEHVKETDNADITF